MHVVKFVGTQWRPYRLWAAAISVVAPYVQHTIPKIQVLLRRADGSFDRIETALAPIAEITSERRSTPTLTYEVNQVVMK